MTNRENIVALLAHIVAEAEPKEQVWYDDRNRLLPGHVGLDMGTFGSLDLNDSDLGRLTEVFDTLQVDDDTVTATRNGGLPAPNFCGTALCAAGWATILSGLPQVWTKDYSTDGHTVLELSGVKDGRTVYAVGRDWLGLTEGEANSIFFNTNANLDDLCDMFADVLEEDESALRTDVEAFAATITPVVTR